MLLRTGLEVLTERALGQADEILGRAGVPKAFYHYFDNKEAFGSN